MSEERIEVDGYTITIFPEMDCTVRIDPSQLDDAGYVRAVKKTCEMFDALSAYFNLQSLARLYKASERYTYTEATSIIESSQCAMRHAFTRALINNDPAMVSFQHHLGACAMIAKTEDLANKYKDTNPGYVYVLKSSSGFYKIGKTANPNDRLRTFSVKLPFEVEFEFLRHTPKMSYMEKLMHLFFAPKRINGEWFAFCQQDLDQLAKTFKLVRQQQS